MPARYPFPFTLVPGLAAAALLNLPRSLREDARRAVESLHPPLVVLGDTHIPPAGPYLVTINHYSRPGFGAWWLVLGVSAILPVPVHWVITAYWRFENHPWRSLLSPLSRWVLQRVARTYHFTTMPALPPDPEEVPMRAAAVRRILVLSRESEPPVIGLAPEGRDASQEGLTLPLPGVGRLVEHLVRGGYKVLPVGIYEQEGLVVHFGGAYTPVIQSGGSAEVRDLWMRKLVMGRIAALLPERLRGDLVMEGEQVESK